MAVYKPVPANFEQLNSAQQNEVAISLGYTGVNDLRDNANKQKEGGGGVNYVAPQQQAVANINGGGTIGSSAGFGVTTPTINLPQLYQGLYDNSGITAIEADLSAKEKAYNERISKINDNPFLSEATRTGRVAKLGIDYQNSVASLKNDVAVKKADIETQMNLQSKQFDINSQQAQLALSQFNTLLSAGALDNATGEDIANIVRSTGLSSTMIINAVNSRKKDQVETSTISYDDGTNQGFAIINSKTGEIISKQVVAASKPKEPTKATESDKKDSKIELLKSDAASGATLSQIFAIYGGYIDADTIYQLYNANSKWGPDNNVKALAKYGVKQPTY